MVGNHCMGLGLTSWTQFCHFQVRTLGYQVIFGPKTAFLRTYHNPAVPDGFDQVKKGWIPLEGTKTEQFCQILSLLGLYNRSQGSYQVIFGPKTAFLRTYHDPVDPDGFDQVKQVWKSLEGTRTEQFHQILSLSGPHSRSYRPRGPIRSFLGLKRPF